LVGAGWSARIHRRGADRRAVWPANAALVGPALEPRPADADFPWDWLDPGRKHLLVTMGTLSMDLAEGSTAGWRRRSNRWGQASAIVVAPEYAIPDPPAHVLVLRRCRCSS